MYDATRIKPTVVAQDTANNLKPKKNFRPIQSGDVTPTFVSSEGRNLHVLAGSTLRICSIENVGLAEPKRR